MLWDWSINLHMPMDFESEYTVAFISSLYMELVDILSTFMIMTIVLYANHDIYFESHIPW